MLHEENTLQLNLFVVEKSGYNFTVLQSFQMPRVFFSVKLTEEDTEEDIRTHIQHWLMETLRFQVRVKCRYHVTRTSDHVKW